MIIIFDQSTVIESMAAICHYVVQPYGHCCCNMINVSLDSWDHVTVAILAVLFTTLSFQAFRSFGSIFSPVGLEAISFHFFLTLVLKQKNK